MVDEEPWSFLVLEDCLAILTLDKTCLAYATSIKPLSIMSNYLPVFLVNKYRLVLIITRIKPEIMGHVVHFVVCVHRVRRFRNERDETMWLLSTDFENDKGALSLNCRNLKKIKKYKCKCKCIKSKSGSTNPLHRFFMTLFSCAGTSSVLELCICDFRPVLPMEYYYLYIGTK